MDYLSDRLKYDTDVYDALPDKDPENYIQGFCTSLYIPNSLVTLSRVEKNLDKSNAMAVIPTNYATTDEKDVPYSVVYILHESIVERGVFAVTQRAAYSLMLDIFSDEPVYFHKGWVRRQYVPGLYDDMKKHSVLSGHGTLMEYVPKEEARRIFREYDKTKQCYTPKNDGTDMCSMKKMKYHMVCSKCFLSDIFGRYCNTRKGML